MTAVTHKSDVVSGIWWSRFRPESGRLTSGAGNEKEDMTQRYASRTTVTVDRSKAEVEHILRRYGADQFLHGWETGRAIIGFRLKGYPVRMTLPLPILEDFEHYARKNGTKTRRTAPGRAECPRAGRAAGLAGPGAGPEGQAGGRGGGDHHH